MNLEAVETRHELVGRPFRPVLRMHHEEHVREARAEVGAVCVVVLRRLGHVNVQTLGTVELDHSLARYVR